MLNMPIESLLCFLKGTFRFGAQINDAPASSFA
jgi:hypothetical protein